MVAVVVAVPVMVVVLAVEHIEVRPLDLVVDSDLVASLALRAPMDSVDPVDNIDNWLVDMDALDIRIAVLVHKLLEAHILESNFTKKKTMHSNNCDFFGRNFVVSSTSTIKTKCIPVVVDGMVDVVDILDN